MLRNTSVDAKGNACAHFIPRNYERWTESGPRFPVPQASVNATPAVWFRYRNLDSLRDFQRRYAPPVFYQRRHGMGFTRRGAGRRQNRRRGR